MMSRHIRAYVRRQVRSSFTADYEATVEDISLSGCFVCTRAHLTAGQDVTLYLPSADGPEFELSGSVVRVRAAPPGYGVAFHRLPTRAQREIAILIARSYVSPETGTKGDLALDRRD